jgi:hypothetical protein
VQLPYIKHPTAGSRAQADFAPLVVCFQVCCMASWKPVAMKRLLWDFKEVSSEDFDTSY